MPADNACADLPDRVDGGRLHAATALGEEPAGAAVPAMR